MNVRAIVLGITALASVGLLAGLGVLFFGSPNEVARVPASGLLGAAVVVFGGTIYLQKSKPRDAPPQKSQSILSTVAFGILIVMALALVGVLVTMH